MTSTNIAPVQAPHKAKPRQPVGWFLASNGRTRTSPPRAAPFNPPDPRNTDVEALRREAEVARAALTFRDEPEQVGPRWLEDYAQVADLHRSQQHAKDVAAAQVLRPLLDVDDRVRDIQRRAKYAHVNLSHEVHIMQRDIERAKRGGRAAPIAVMNRCEKLEALLDGIAA